MSTQLILSSSIALAILALAIWYVNHSFVLNVAADGLETAAALKAKEISVSINLLYASCLYLSALGELQQALMRYNNGSDTSSANWDEAAADLEASLSHVGSLSHAPGAQIQLYSRNLSGPAGADSVLNVTGIGYEVVQLPYRNVDGTPAYFGMGDLGYPPALYPNLTISKGLNDPSSASYLATFDGIVLGLGSNLVLGPLLVNESFSLLSMTVPVLENASATNVLGWITVVQDAQYLQEVVQDRTGLGETGITLLFGPVNKTNHFPPNVLGTDQARQTDVRFLFPVGPSATSRHPAHAVGTANPPFPAYSYPVVAQAISDDLHGSGTVGSMMSTHNEDNQDVSAAYATVDSDLVDWVLVVEKLKSEVWKPIVHLRDIILACFFSVFGFVLLISLPAATWFVRPITRLRVATQATMDPLYNGSKASLPQPNDGLTYFGRHDVTSKKSFLSSLAWWRKPKDSSCHSVVDEGGEKRFRIPSKVEISKYWISDDLTDLMKTFNDMADELYLQYCKLEERIQQRTVELEQSKQAAEAANESKTLFVANVSHELKTPLNGILGMCAISIEEDDVQQMKTAMSIIYKSGDMLLRTLNDLLTFSTNQVGNQILSLEEREFVLQDLEFQVLAIFTKTAEEKDVKLLVQYEDGYANLSRMKDITLWGDVHRILQIVINLVSNSLKYTAAGGSVTFIIRRSTELAPSRSRLGLDQQSIQSYKKRASAMLRGDKSGTANYINPNEAPPIEAVSFAPSGTDVFFELEVRDNGEGIPEDMQNRIFEPFVQGESGLNRTHSGTGLGLSICHQLCKLMKGDISLISSLGEGSRFIVKIPLRHVTATPTTRTSLTSKEDVPKEYRDVEYNQPTTADQRSIETTLRQADMTQSKVSQSNPNGSPQESAVKKARKEAKANQKAEQHDFSRARILVAEDNKVNQKVIMRMLGLEQILQVTVAEDGQKALDLVKTSLQLENAEDSPYDLILMDIQMPNMDGLTSTKLIRKSGCKTPIVALTAFAEQSNIDDCYQSGMDYFLAKPLQRPQLKDVLIKFCSSLSISSTQTAQTATSGTSETP